MAWINPKTNWIKTDYFNIGDYNRIKNNLIHIREMALELYPNVPYGNMGKDKTYTDYYYPDEINVLEDNLESINLNTFPRDIGETKAYYENQPFIDYEELNRIEKAIHIIYLGLLGQANGRRRLAFTLGRRRVV